MKIKIIVAPQTNPDSYWKPLQPLGVGIITSYLKSKGYSVDHDDLDIKAIVAERELPNEYQKVSMEPFRNIQKVKDFLLQNKSYPELENNLKQQGLDPDAIASADAAVFTEQAKKRVALQLIFAEIIKQNGLKADPAKVREMIEQAASGYEDPNAVINWYYSDEKNLAKIEALALEDNVVDWVLAHAEVTDKACTFDEIMNKGQTAI